MSEMPTQTPNQPLLPPEAYHLRRDSPAVVSTAGRAVLGGNQAPVAPKSLNEKLVDLANASEKRPQTAFNKGNLAPGSKDKLFKGSVIGQAPIVSKELFSGNAKESLSHLVLVGDTWLGVTSLFNNKTNKVDKVTLMTLPIGAKASSKNSPTILAEFSMAQLGNQVVDGAKQDWQTVNVGRSTLQEKQGFVDDKISKNHLAFTVTSEGNIDIEDHNSTNGTQVLTMNDTMPGMLDQSGMQALGALQTELFLNPHMWDAKNAGITVINAQQA